MVFKFYTKFGSRVWIKNWSYAEATQLRLHQCIDVVAHLKTLANIPLHENIWDEGKIANLIAETKKRKALYFLVFGGVLACGLAAFIFFILTSACILDGTRCSEERLNRSVIYFVISTVIATALLTWIKKIGRNQRKVDLEYYFSSKLSEAQKSALIREINQLKNDEEALYEVGNYEELRKIASIFWKSENWFLLLTDNEADRFSIWLDGEHPKGRLVIERLNEPSNSQIKILSQSSHASEQINLDVEQEKPETKTVAVEEKFWECVKGKNSRDLFPSEAKLTIFINGVDKLRLPYFHAAWLDALIIVRNNHGKLRGYLSGKLNGEQQIEFEKKLTPIFATISKSYMTAIEGLSEDEIPKVDTYKYGIKGAEKFLFGKNENIDDWIGRNRTNVS